MFYTNNNNNVNIPYHILQYSCLIYYLFIYLGWFEINRLKLILSSIFRILSPLLDHNLHGFLVFSIWLGKSMLLAIIYNLKFYMASSSKIEAFCTPIYINLKWKNNVLFSFTKKEIWIQHLLWYEKLDVNWIICYFLTEKNEKKNINVKKSLLRWFTLTNLSNLGRKGVEKWFYILLSIF